MAAAFLVEQRIVSGLTYVAMKRSRSNRSFDSRGQNQNRSFEAGFCLSSKKSRFNVWSKIPGLNARRPYGDTLSLPWSVPSLQGAYRRSQIPAHLGKIWMGLCCVRAPLRTGGTHPCTGAPTHAPVERLHSQHLSGFASQHPQTPKGVLVCDHAGRVINKLSRSLSPWLSGFAPNTSAASLPTPSLSPQRLRFPTLQRLRFPTPSPTQ